MTFILLHKIYLGVAVAFVIALVTYSSISHFQISRMEAEVEKSKQAASFKEKVAAEKEKQAVEYKAKIEYLEQQLTEIQTIARKQDDELEKLNTNTSDARGALDRARRTRTVTANGKELCARLAEIGHGCEP